MNVGKTVPYIPVYLVKTIFLFALKSQGVNL